MNSASNVHKPLLTNHNQAINDPTNQHYLHVLLITAYNQSLSLLLIIIVQQPSWTNYWINEALTKYHSPFTMIGHDRRSTNHCTIIKQPFANHSQTNHQHQSLSNHQPILIPKLSNNGSGAFLRSCSTFSFAAILPSVARRMPPSWRPYVGGHAELVDRLVHWLGIISSIYATIMGNS